MSRFSRINTVWRKELVDTLRDRRTVVAMVLVPMVVYPALMLGSIQAFEAQVSQLVKEKYDVAVATEKSQAWLRRLIDSDPARRAGPTSAPAEQVVEQARGEGQTADGEAAPSAGEPPIQTGAQSARAGVRNVPPEYDVWVAPDVVKAVTDGVVHVGVLIKGEPPLPGDRGSTPVLVVFDDSDIRSQIAAAGIEGILDRANLFLLRQRLDAANLTVDFVRPIATSELNVASPERMAGALLGQIVPLILIIMTITGAIYPAIDLTAGERERGTLETLMVAPVPTVDLIAGKFIVVTIIGMLSAVLNLLSIGGTIYLGGLGSLLTQGAQLTIPLSALGWILVLLLPLAVMFSAMLLAVCSFARSFKEAQNYIVPVMMAALIPGVVGILPGTRLEGPIIIMPVANIVVLTRELFLARFDYAAIALVLLSTSLYAAAAVAIAAKLFGQEAVLFADAGSVKTVFQRRFFKPRAVPSAAQALLVVTIVYSLNFFIQQQIAKSGLNQGLRYLNAIALTIVVLFAIGPWFAARYMRVNLTSTFRLHAPDLRGLVAGLCFGCSTWILALRWSAIQAQLLPMDSRVARALEQAMGWMNDVNPVVLVFFLALVPALCEELFFRGYALSGLRGAVGNTAAVVIVALAFGMAHYSAYRLIPTTALGLILGTLVVRYRSIWPAMVAHFLHNALSILATHPLGLNGYLTRYGFPAAGTDQALPGAWVAAAGALTLLGVLLCIIAPRRESDPIADRDPPSQP